MGTHPLCPGEGSTTLHPSKVPRGKKERKKERETEKTREGEISGKEVAANE
jgi:hypothetical protein